MKAFILKGNSCHEDDAVPSSQSKGTVNGFDIRQSKLVVIQQTKSVDLIVSKFKYNNEGKVFSYLFPIKSSSPITITDFKMEQYFYDTVLKDMKSYLGILKMITGSCHYLFSASTLHMHSSLNRC